MDEDTAAAARTLAAWALPVEGERRPPSWLTTRGLDGPDSLIERCHSADKKRPVEYLNESRSWGERERERGAWIGGPKFRVSSWLINVESGSIYTAGYRPAFGLTSRVDACQLTVANRSLRVYLRYQASLSCKRCVLFALETETMRIDRGN